MAMSSTTLPVTEQLALESRAVSVRQVRIRLSVGAFLATAGRSSVLGTDRWPTRAGVSYVPVRLVALWIHS